MSWSFDWPSAQLPAWGSQGPQDPGVMGEWATLSGGIQDSWDSFRIIVISQGFRVWKSCGKKVQNRLIRY